MGPKGGRAKTAKKADGPGAKKAPSSKTKTSAARAGSRAAREKDVFVSEDADAYMKRLRRNFSNADDEDDAGDSDDNLRVRKQDDEDVDDDGSSIGWDSNDELAYGGLMGGARRDANASDESDQEEAEEGEILLSDLLGGNGATSRSSANNEAKKGQKGKKAKAEPPSKSEDNSAARRSARRQAAQSQEDDDDDEDKGSDFEYDYEQKLEEGGERGGSGGGSTSDDSASDSDEDSDSDGDDDIEDVHARLLSAIDRFAQPTPTSASASTSAGGTNKGGKTSSGKKGGSSNSLQTVSENQHSSVAESWGGGGSADATVTMDALLGALDGEQGLAVVKQKLNDLEKGLGAPVFVEKVTSDRAERVHAYDGNSKDMSKWQATVNVNRNARTLDVAQDQRITSNYKTLIRKHIPTTDMEKEVAMVLVKTGATEAQATSAEDDELGARNLTIEELRSRQADLAKTRALLFYEQMKRHRINKIKSKAYHRIKKRKRVRLGQESAILAESDPELLKQLQEDAAMKRVKERMNLRHKSTGKFAQEMLRHGHGSKSMRDAYNESVALGNELQEEMHADPTARGGGDSSDEDAFSGSDDGNNASNSRKDNNKKTAAKASRALRKAGVLGTDVDGEDEQMIDGKYSKLFEMDFMKKAREQQKERAREEAQSVLKEIEDMEGANGGYSDSDDDANANAKSKAPSSSEVHAAKQRMEGLFGAGKGMSIKPKKSAFSTEASSSAAATEDTAANGVDAEMQGKKGKKGKGKFKAAAEPETSDASNPWLAGPSAQSGKNRSTRNKNDSDTVHAALDTIINSGSSNGVGGSAGKKGKKGKGVLVAVQPASTAVSSASTTTSATTDSGDKKDSKSAQGKQGQKRALVDARTQEDLVEMAFAGPDLEEDFAAYKSKVVDDELGIDAKKRKIVQDVKAGWGDWAGPGPNGGQVSAKILGKRDKLMKQADQEADVKRAGRADTKTPNVLLSDRRIKTASKFKIAEIPHPFTSRAEYEKSLTMPIGEEWNASHVVRQNTKPDVFLRAGRVVEPIKLAKSRERVSAQAKATGGVSITTAEKFGGNRKFKG